MEKRFIKKEIMFMTPEQMFNKIIQCQNKHLACNLKYCPSCHTQSVSDGICSRCCFLTDGYDPYDSYDFKDNISEESEPEMLICPICDGTQVSEKDGYCNACKLVTVSR